MAEEKKSDFRVDIPDRDSNTASPLLRSGARSPAMQPASQEQFFQSAMFPILSYCGASILMTVTNKFVLSGYDFNMNFFLLSVQSVVCVVAIQGCKTMGFISYRDFKVEEAKKWFPISLSLIVMIYTSSKALQFLSIPVYTIFKNLTIILIAYGEVLWFGGSVTGPALFSFGLMVLSSVVAAWADIRMALSQYGHSSAQASTAISTLNAGYMWMLVNCLSTAGYVLGMRKRIIITQFKDFDTMFYNNLLTIPILLLCSLFLEDWGAANMDKNFPVDRRNALIFAMVFSGLSTIFISYTSAWCVRRTTSTTYSMVGALNKLPIALSGLIFFDTAVTFASVTAIGIGFLSGIMYTLAKLKQKKDGEKVLPTTNKGVTSASAASMRDSFKQ